ncbi:hypothetical protein NLG97_g1631 [Lecanicillium saksenae]|uniref:Uncharacterized protein n=1 Tax=Lecanicillium saksenae TaxID=468837 RepID=A0ACC1R3E6_9HYPO|nr:hypothetical protein NLG97_g1631 [Lecanicillium saksenae]
MPQEKMKKFKLLAVTGSLLLVPTVVSHTIDTRGKGWFGFGTKELNHDEAATLESPVMLENEDSGWKPDGFHSQGTFSEFDDSQDFSAGTAADEAPFDSDASGLHLDTPSDDSYWSESEPSESLEYYDSSQGTEAPIQRVGFADSLGVGVSATPLDMDVKAGVTLADPPHGSMPTGKSSSHSGSSSSKPIPPTSSKPSSSATTYQPSSSGSSSKATSGSSSKSTPGSSTMPTSSPSSKPSSSGSSSKPTSGSSSGSSSKPISGSPSKHSSSMPSSTKATSGSSSKPTPGNSPVPSPGSSSNLASSSSSKHAPGSPTMPYGNSTMPSSGTSSKPTSSGSAILSSGSPIKPTSGSSSMPSGSSSMHSGSPSMPQRNATMLSSGRSSKSSTGSSSMPSDKSVMLSTGSSITRRYHLLEQPNFGNLVDAFQWLIDTQPQFYDALFSKLFTPFGKLIDALWQPHDALW